MKPSALAAVATSALPADSSLVSPMVSRLKRAAPNTAGTEPVPPTSQDFDADARNPSRKSAECRLEPELSPPALLVRDIERQRPVKRRLIAHFDFRDLRMSKRCDCRERSHAKQFWCCLHHRFLLLAGKT